MNDVEKWRSIKRRFGDWWSHAPLERPLVYVVSRREEYAEAPESFEPARNATSIHLDVERKVIEYRNFCRAHDFYGEAFPYLDLNLGAGSLALYLGAEPRFSRDTVWFEPCVAEWSSTPPMRFEPENIWWKRHLDMVRRGVTLAGGAFPISVPDLCENIDILSAMQGPQELCYSLIDEPEAVLTHIERLQEVYPQYFEPMYELVKDVDGGCCIAFFNVWAPGRAMKVQCDMSAMLSQHHFQEIVLPSLERQMNHLDYVLYHLDGKDAIRHLDALLKIDAIDALQWEPGAGQEDCGGERWYPIYERARRAGKSLWLKFTDGNSAAWVERATRIVRNFGKDGMYFVFPTVCETDDARRILDAAERDWH